MLLLLLFFALPTVRIDNPLIDLHSEGITPLNRTNPPSQLYTVLDRTGVTATTHCTPHSAPSQLSSFTPPLVFKPDTPQPISQPFPATADQLNPTSSPPYITHELYPPPSLPPPQACQPLSPSLGL